MHLLPTHRPVRFADPGVVMITFSTHLFFSSETAEWSVAQELPFSSCPCLLNLFQLLSDEKAKNIYLTTWQQIYLQLDPSLTCVPSLQWWRTHPALFSLLRLPPPFAAAPFYSTLQKRLFLCSHFTSICRRVRTGGLLLAPWPCKANRPDEV